jgi:excisionase family DNA binding protein
MRRGLLSDGMAAADEWQWLDAGGAGRYLNLPTSTVYRLIQDGRLEALSWPVRVRRPALDECIERCRITPGELPYASRLKGHGAEPPITAKGVPDRRYGPVTRPARDTPPRGTGDAGDL